MSFGSIAANQTCSSNLSSKQAPAASACCEELAELRILLAVRERGRAGRQQEQAGEAIIAAAWIFNVREIVTVSLAAAADRRHKSVVWAARRTISLWRHLLARIP